MAYQTALVAEAADSARRYSPGLVALATALLSVRAAQEGPTKTATQRTVETRTFTTLLRPRVAVESPQKTAQRPAGLAERASGRLRSLVAAGRIPATVLVAAALAVPATARTVRTAALEALQTAERAEAAEGQVERPVAVALALGPMEGVAATVGFASRTPCRRWLSLSSQPLKTAA
jgi:hypothetical protein